MPLPTPNDGEDHDKFMGRCMGNPTMNEDFPDNKQRYAVCQSQWNKKKKSADEALIERRYVKAAELAAQREKADELPSLHGYAALFDTPTELYPGVMERVAKGAFTRTLKEGADVRALVDHDSSKLLGRTKSGTLQLREDGKGLNVLIKPPDTTVGRDTVTSVERGDLDQMSFAFRVMRHTILEKDDDTSERVIEDVDLFDVSVVTFPAYEETNIEVVKRAIEAHRRKPPVPPPPPSPPPSPSVQQEAILEAKHRQRMLETKYGSPFTR